MGCQNWQNHRKTIGLHCSAETIATMHYRLRGPIGLLNVQKVSESRRLFLTEGTSKTDNFALFVKIMTQIFCTIIFSQGWQSETGQKSDKCLEKPEGGLRRS